jgi:hypothetical protein
LEIKEGRMYGNSLSAGARSEQQSWAAKGQGRLLPFFISAALEGAVPVKTPTPEFR